MTLRILTRADGRRMIQRGGLFSGLGRARLHDAFRLWVVRLQPFITVKKRHRMGVDRLHLHARFT